MVALVQRLKQDGAHHARGRASDREAGKDQGGQGPASSLHLPLPAKEKTFSLALEFRKSDVPREEIVRALQGIIEDLMREES